MGPLTTNSSDFYVVNNKINHIIGNPIPYEKYVKNGRKNPNGSRKIFQGQVEDDTDDDLFQQASNARNILQQKKA
jgi:hypothetical protein